MSRRDGPPASRRPPTPQMQSRYPGFDVMSQASHWDEATRSAIAERLQLPRRFAFFTAAEVETLEPFCDTVLAQDAEPRIPVLAYIDQRLSARSFDGFRYEDMPTDEQTWRLFAQGLDEAAREHGHDGYASCPQPLREEICAQLAGGEAPAGEVWPRLPRAWKVVMRYVLSAFYAHPWAWNEIGFAGPAYPRGYSRLAAGERESFEAAEADDGRPR